MLLSRRNALTAAVAALLPAASPANAERRRRRECEPEMTPFRRQLGLASLDGSIVPQVAPYLAPGPATLVAKARNPLELYAGHTVIFDAITAIVLLYCVDHLNDALGRVTALSGWLEKDSVPIATLPFAQSGEVNAARSYMEWSASSQLFQPIELSGTAGITIRLTASTNDTAGSTGNVTMDYLPNLAATSLRPSQLILYGRDVVESERRQLLAAGGY